ncbi:MAG: hypothetical protein WBM35_03525, partial [Candidatus Electrothrix sp.]
AFVGTTILPDKWITPVIQGIALPAHAQTSAPGVSFCGDPVQLRLVSGHSGTDLMTIEATGCITPPQANTELALTLDGYKNAIITSKGEDSGSGLFLALISDALVPSVNAASAPDCSVTVKVKTDGDGSFKAAFPLTYGKGIVQVVLRGVVNGATFSNIGLLDIASCNPCSTDAKANVPLGKAQVYVEGDLTVEYNGDIYTPQGATLTIDGNSPNDLKCNSPSGGLCIDLLNENWGNLPDLPVFDCIEESTYTVSASTLAEWIKLETRIIVIY